jgi:glycosyltransferase involved in cell wall biosynthesis
MPGVLALDEIMKFLQDDVPTNKEFIWVTEPTTTTVIIPVFNGEEFIDEALASVLPQLGADDEVVVVDDASTDRTRNRLHRCDPRVSVIDSPGRGPSAARNVGLALARGAFIAFLDHDDLWPAGRHRALLCALLGNEAFNAAAGRIRIKVEDTGSPGDYLALDGRHTPSILMTCLYRRELIDKVGLFDEDMRFGEDFNYYVRLSEAGMKLTTCEQDSLTYRRHGRNATNSAPAGNKVLMNILARKLARARGSASKIPLD